MRYITFLLTTVLLSNCHSNSTSNVPVEKSNAATAKSDISDESIFNLTTTWRTEENKEITLKELKGKVLVMVMIYTSCKAACPRLVADMKNISLQIPENKKNDVQYILISIDPTNDTPERLKAFAIEKEMDGDEWTFLQGNKESVQEFANVLSVKYREISPMDFSHSNIISVFNHQGELIHQQEGLGVNNQETVKTIIETAK
ncbi:MAG: SCO family protein [Chitinophagales bacterium]|nr:SCO family protein [Chitinophagales bacterium]